jgi:hypothetical protein
MDDFIVLYKEVADLIDSAQRRGSNIVSFVDQMAIDLNNSDIQAEELDRERLDKQIKATSDILTERHSRYTVYMRNFVFQLEKYTDDNYISVNQFLSSNSIKVKTVFADISEVVGFPIDPENIEGSLSA